MESFTKLFKALSDPTRLRILYLLISAKTELCICELIEALDIPQYNTSKHMKELKTAGLVKERKEGRFVFYSLQKCCDVFSEKVLATVRDASSKKLDADLKRLNKRMPLKFRVCKKCSDKNDRRRK